MTGLIDNGAEATELGQCPHRPGTPEWRQWQQDYRKAQSADGKRVSEAMTTAQKRAVDAGICIDLFGNMRYINEPRPPLNAAAERAAAAIAEANEYDRAQRGAATATGWQAGWHTGTLTWTSQMAMPSSFAAAVGMTVTIPTGSRGRP